MTAYDQERERFPVPVDLVIRTRVPSKWVAWDQETGEAWVWEGGHKGTWKRYWGVHLHIDDDIELTRTPVETDALAAVAPVVFDPQTKQRIVSE